MSRPRDLSCRHSLHPGRKETQIRNGRPFETPQAPLFEQTNNPKTEVAGTRANLQDMARSRTVRIPDADPPLASNPRENGRTFFAPRLKIDGKNEPDAPPEPLNGTASRRTMFEVFVEFNRQRETRTKFRLHSHTVALSEERAETKQGAGNRMRANAPFDRQINHRQTQVHAFVRRHRRQIDEIAIRSRIDIFA